MFLYQPLRRMWEKSKVQSGLLNAEAGLEKPEINFSEQQKERGLQQHPLPTPLNSDKSPATLPLIADKTECMGTEQLASFLMMFTAENFRGMRQAKTKCQDDWAGEQLLTGDEIQQVRNKQ